MMNNDKVKELMERASREIENFKAVEKKIMYRVINAQWHEKELKSLVHICVMNLAIIFYVQIGEVQDGILQAKVSKDLLSCWNIDITSLWQTAYHNTCMNYPVILTDMSDFLKNVMDLQGVEMLDMLESEPACNLTIMTNQKNIYGAAAMLYGGALKEYANQIQGDLLILPSSIHEVLLVKYEEPFDVIGLSNMVASINRSEVAEEEQLSNKVYIYHWEQDVLEDTDSGDSIRPGGEEILERLTAVEKAS